jgi:hypothetical protein
MTSKPTNAVSAPAPEDSRRSFDAAMAQLQQKDRRNPSQTPICARSQKRLESDPSAEKQALRDAARALARLWNLSPSLIR